VLSDAHKVALSIFTLQAPERVPALEPPARLWIELLKIDQKNRDKA
jgi:hypothetical protein